MRGVMAAALLIVACGDDAADARMDAGSVVDGGDAGGTPGDAAPGDDGAVADAGATDAGTTDPWTWGLGGDEVRVVPGDGPFGYDDFRPGNAGFPEPGEAFVDPVFGTTIVRLTDLVGREDLGNFPYARNGFASADGSRLMGPGGIIDVATGTVLDPAAPSGAFTSSFHPLDPDLLYHHAGPTLMRYDFGTRGDSFEVRSFAGPLGGLGGSVDWIDRTGRFMALSIDGEIRVYDAMADRLFTGALSAGVVGSGWVGIAPDARWLVVAGEGGHRAFAIDPDAGTLDTEGHVFWTLCGDHGDLMTASDGRTYMITQECYDSPHVYAVDVSLAQSGDDAPGRQKQRDDNRFLFAIEWEDGTHFSAAATGGMEDWAFVSTEREGADGNDPANPWTPYMNEIVMVNVLDGTVRRLAHHRSNITGYCTQPRVQAAWDGSAVFFASNFARVEGGGCGYGDLYAILLR